MSGATDCLAALRKHGPLRTAQLVEMTCDHGGGVARNMAKLIEQGRVRRIDGGAGRGSIALYALVGQVRA
jgi:hypothetical protein